MPPSLKPFVREGGSQLGRQLLARGLTYWAGYLSSEIDARADPRSISLHQLRRMDTDPIVYLAEWAITGLMRDPELYHVKHPHGEKAIEQETTEWLWPLLPLLLPTIARSFIYGAVPYVFDWGKEDLVIRIPSKRTGKPRRAVLGGHLHYVDVHEIFPGDVEVEVNDQNRVQAVLFGGQRYGKGRSRVSIWDRQFGELGGQSARRRAWSPWAKGEIFTKLQAKYLERTVHAPMIFYGDEETIKEEGDASEVSVLEFILEKYSELLGGGAMALPGDVTTDGGKRVFEAIPIELPERSGVFDRALNRFDGLKFAAYLTPAALTGFDEGIGSGASRVLKELFSVFVSGLVRYAATELNAIVEEVHKANHSMGRVAPAEVGANEIPDKVQKLYLEVLKFVAEPSSVGKRIDVDTMLDQMGLPRRDQEDQDVVESVGAEGGAPAKPAGRPRDATGQREERREDARTDEGSEDTGQRGGRPGGEALSSKAIELQLAEHLDRRSELLELEVLRQLASRPAPAAAAPDVTVHNHPAPPAAAPSVTVEPTVVHVDAATTVEPAQVNVVNEIPQAAPPTVVVQAAEQALADPPQVTVNVTNEVPPQDPPTVENVINLPPQQVDVNVTNEVPLQEPPDVNVTVNPELKLPPRDVRFKRDRFGKLTGAEAEDAEGADK